MSYYTVNLSGLPNTPFGHAVKNIVDFVPVSPKDNVGTEILTGMVQHFWLMAGQRILHEKGIPELKDDLHFGNLSATETLKITIEWANCAKFCLAYVESWVKLSLSELELWEAIFSFEQARQLLDPEQKGDTHFDYWIATQKEWKHQAFVDDWESTGQRVLCDRWRSFKRDLGNEENPFKKNNPQEFYRRILILLALEIHRQASTDFKKIFVKYQQSYANHLRTLRYGIEYEGEKNIRKQTLKKHGSKLVLLEKNTKRGIPKRGIPLQLNKSFSSRRGRKSKKPI